MCKAVSEWDGCSPPSREAESPSHRLISAPEALAWGLLWHLTLLSSVNEYAATALSKITKKASEVGNDPLISEHAAAPQGTAELPFSVRVISSPASPLQVFGGMFGALLEALGTIGIVIVLVVFFLIRREDLRDRFIHIVGKGHASTAVVIAALYLAKSLLVPLTLAVLLSFLLMPACEWLERRHLGRIPAVFVTAILGFTMFGIVAWIAVIQMTHLAPKIPEYQNNIEAKSWISKMILRLHRGAP